MEPIEFMVQLLGGGSGKAAIVGAVVPGPRHQVEAGADRPGRRRQFAPRSEGHQLAGAFEIHQFVLDDGRGGAHGVIKPPATDQLAFQKPGSVDPKEESAH